ncbi:DUF2442 domain-containing protein [Rhizobium sp. YIM 134829]|uniref:DUF2442 domain-containing protein n=1 Tax=Rhizobium sp. YIM 134829 TaxID=3390453 RepID=UPI00397B69E1
MDQFRLTKHAYRRATERGERARGAVPVGVGFDEASGRIVIDFDNGTTFLVPAERLQGLQGASAAQLNEVQLLGETGLHWESLDVDFTIEGLMRGLLGTAHFMEAQRRGGRSRSDAKIAASRANGAKGGRPRRV